MTNKGTKYAINLAARARIESENKQKLIQRQSEEILKLQGRLMTLAEPAFIPAFRAFLKLRKNHKK